LAAELESRLDQAEVQLVPGGGGVFDVSRDGELIYSKRETGLFPDASDILNAL